MFYTTNFFEKITKILDLKKPNQIKQRKNMSKVITFTIQITNDFKLKCSYILSNNKKISIT